MPLGRFQLLFNVWWPSSVPMRSFFLIHFPGRCGIACRPVGFKNQWPFAILHLSCGLSCTCFILFRTSRSQIDHVRASMQFKSESACGSHRFVSLHQAVAAVQVCTQSQFVLCSSTVRCAMTGSVLFVFKYTLRFIAQSHNYSVSVLALKCEMAPCVVCIY